MNSALATSLTVGATVGGTAGYLGSLMITRRLALVGDALGHVALPGMGLALLLGVDPSLGALAFLLGGILLLWQLEQRTPLTLETLVGVLFVSSLAVGFLVVPEPELLESLIGDLSKVTPPAGIAAAAASIAIAFIIRRIYGDLMLLTISEDLAAVRGISGRRHNLLFLLSIALVVALGVRITGSLLVGASVILPPAAARLVSSDLRRYSWTSALIGGVASVAGILAAAAARLPAGPIIVLLNGFVFGASLIARAQKVTSPGPERQPR